MCKAILIRDTVKTNEPICSIQCFCNVHCQYLHQGQPKWCDNQEHTSHTHWHRETIMWVPVHWYPEHLTDLNEAYDNLHCREGVRLELHKFTFLTNVISARIFFLLTGQLWVSEKRTGTSRHTEIDSVNEKALGWHKNQGLKISALVSDTKDKWVSSRSTQSIVCQWILLQRQGSNLRFAR